MPQNEHPLLLCALEKYVRVPLSGTWLDTHLMLPAKQTYMRIHEMHMTPKKEKRP
jgi:hypothetical protein